MTPREFESWLAYHGAAFPGLRAWFQGLDSPQSTRDAWQRTLSRLTLQQARAATDAMLEQGTTYYRYEQHPGLLLERHRALSESRRSPTPPGGAGPECPHCRDTGFIVVYVYSRLSNRWYMGLSEAERLEARLGRERAERETQAVRCTCKHGQRMAACVAVWDPGMEAVA
jgi:hypothetical protein